MSDRKYRQQGYQDGARTGSASGGSGPGRPDRLEGGPRGRGADRNRDEVFRCTLCGEKNDPEVTLSAACRKCGAPLHACTQCRHFDAAAGAQCRLEVPVPVAAKSAANDCGSFAAAITLDMTGHKAADTPDSARSAFDRLFGKS